jgi:hypothetical protein
MEAAIEGARGSIAAGNGFGVGEGTGIDVSGGVGVAESGGVGGADARGGTVGNGCSAGTEMGVGVGGGGIGLGIAIGSIVDCRGAVGALAGIEGST